MGKTWYKYGSASWQVWTSPNAVSEGIKYIMKKKLKKLNRGILI